MERLLAGVPSFASPVAADAVLERNAELVPAHDGIAVPIPFLANDFDRLGPVGNNANRAVHLGAKVVGRGHCPRAFEHALDAATVLDDGEGAGASRHVVGHDADQVPFEFDVGRQVLSGTERQQRETRQRGPVATFPGARSGRHAVCRKCS